MGNMQKIEFNKINNYWKEILAKLNNKETIDLNYKNVTQTCINILNFNIIRLQIKIKKLVQ